MGESPEGTEDWRQLFQVVLHLYDSLSLSKRGDLTGYQGHRIKIGW